MSRSWKVVLVAFGVLMAVRSALSLVSPASWIWWKVAINVVRLVIGVGMVIAYLPEAVRGRRPEVAPPEATPPVPSV